PYAFHDGADWRAAARVRLQVALSPAVIGKTAYDRPVQNTAWPALISSPLNRLAPCASTTETVFPHLSWFDLPYPFLDGDLF
ncbi:MAG: hypothetical protein ACREUY_06140, partial [Burkholderiales bacterium]